MFVTPMIACVERGWCPDRITRWGIRRLCAGRLSSNRSDREAPRDDAPTERFLAEMAQEPIARSTAAANAQHYELPVEFFQLFLGPRRKYSCCLWEPSRITIDHRSDDLAAAETRALACTVKRAGVADGQEILELGCGWGSLTLYLAEHFPHSRILAVSNSIAQGHFITRRLRDHGWQHRVEVVTADMNDFATTRRFDRAISIEMFEHMRNYPRLIQRIAAWLHPEGELFVHLFCHRECPYTFDGDGPTNWMGRHFFTGGIMPCEELLPRAAASQGMRTIDRWTWNGEQYARTLNAWLARLDQNRPAALGICRRIYGPRDAANGFQRWRIFLMACAELFAYRQGTEWYVAHYRLAREEGGVS